MTRNINPIAQEDKVLALLAKQKAEILKTENRNRNKVFRYFGVSVVNAEGGFLP